MEDYVGKKHSGDNVLSRRGSSALYRDKIHEDRSTKKCSRLECMRQNSVTSSHIGLQEKSKYSRASSSVSGKAPAGSSWRPISASSSCRRSLQERQDQTFLRQSALAESSNHSLLGESSSREECVQDLDSRDDRVSEEDLESEGMQEGTYESESISASLKHSGSAFLQEGMIEPSVTCTTASTSKPRKPINGRLSSANHDTPSSSVVRRSTIYRSSGHGAKPVSQVLGAGSQKYGLKNLGCTSISDILPSGCSSSGFSHDGRIDTMRRSSHGESSAARSKGLGASASRVPTSANTFVPGLSIPERIRNQPVSRTRNLPNTRDVAVSVRTRRTHNGVNQTRPIRQHSDSTLPMDEPIMIPQFQPTHFSNPEVPPASSSRSFTIELPHEFYSSSGRPGSSHQHSQTRSASRHEISGVQTVHGSLVDGNGYRRLNMEGVTEVLLALEQIEQDAAVSYEQLLMLETTFLLSGLSFHDQHRDMRMDIDNMTYEVFVGILKSVLQLLFLTREILKELLALEEKIGNVSTALSEEQLSKCLKRSIYAPTSRASMIVHGEDDTKCSVCQEDYVGGDEVCKLSCEHRYHAACIQQWLGQKNWCPICKSSALPS